MIQVRFHEQADDCLLKFAVIVSRTAGRWVFCKHRDRDTRFNQTEDAESFGMLYAAEIFSFRQDLHNEIEKIWITEHLAKDWTYPSIQPALIREAVRRGRV